MKQNKTQKKMPRQRRKKYSKCTKETEERINKNEQEMIEKHTKGIPAYSYIRSQKKESRYWKK